MKNTSNCVKDIQERITSLLTSSSSTERANPLVAMQIGPFALVSVGGSSKERLGLGAVRKLLVEDAPFVFV